MKIATLIGFTILLLGGILSEGRNQHIRNDEGGLGPPSVCAGCKGKGGLTLIVDNTTVWEAQK